MTDGAVSARTRQTQIPVDLFRILWITRARITDRESPIRNRVHQPAFAPQPVEPTAQLERASGADVAVKHFAVVPDRLDGVEHPFVVEAEQRAEVAGFAEQPLHDRVVARLRLLV